MLLTCIVVKKLLSTQTKLTHIWSLQAQKCHRSFSQRYFFLFYPPFSHVWWFEGWVIVVRVLCWWGLGASGVWPSLFLLLGRSSVYKHRRKTLGIKMVLYSLTITVIIKGNIMVEAVRCSHPSSALKAATYSPTHMIISPKKFGCLDIFHKPWVINLFYNKQMHDVVSLDTKGKRK